MGKVFAYEDHNGWKDCMFLTDHELTAQERFCPICEAWSHMISEIHSKQELLDVLSVHDIFENDEFTGGIFQKLIKEYEIYSSKEYEKPREELDELEVGLFFYVDNDFSFVGCKLKDAEEYGDFLIYQESHFDVWDKLDCIGYVKGMGKMDYDYFPRGRVVYRKSDETFLVYYDKCIEKEIYQVANRYKDYKYDLELDEHYCCHMCNQEYAI